MIIKTSLIIYINSSKITNDNKNGFIHMESSYVLQVINNRTCRINGTFKKF